MAAQLIQVSTSKGGMPKLAVPTARVTVAGVGNDWQKNRKYHGGPDRAVCLYSVELYAWLQQQLGIALSPGSVGENFTTAGIDLDALQKGDRLRAGSVLIELTDIRVPCKSLNQWHPELMKTIQGRSGWVARVLEEGDVKPGDTIEITNRPKR